MMTAAEGAIWSYTGAACGGKMETARGLLTSPNHPEKYPNNADCIYSISTPVGTNISLTFYYLNIEHDSSCSYDFLEIRDGNSEDSPLLGKFCGTAIPMGIKSSQNNMWMR